MYQDFPYKILTAKYNHNLEMYIYIIYHGRWDLIDKKMTKGYCLIKDLKVKWFCCSTQFCETRQLSLLWHISLPCSDKWSHLLLLLRRTFQNWYCFQSFLIFVRPKRPCLNPRWIHEKWILPPKKMCTWWWKRRSSTKETKAYDAVKSILISA